MIDVAPDHDLRLRLAASGLRPFAQVEQGIETAIELLKTRKAALADALFAGVAKQGLNLTEADISALFAPLEQRRVKRAA